MKSTENKDYVVFSQRLAGYIMFKGCKLKKCSTSKKDETKLVYFFYDNQTVRDLVEQYQQNKIIGGELIEASK